MKKIFYRAKQPTPPFFRRLQKASIVMTIVSMVILLVPVAIPAILLTTAGYVLPGAVVTAIVCQLTVDQDAEFLRWIYGYSPDYLPRFINKDLLK